MSDEEKMSQLKDRYAECKDCPNRVLSHYGFIDGKWVYPCNNKPCQAAKTIADDINQFVEENQDQIRKIRESKPTPSEDGELIDDSEEQGYKPSPSSHATTEAEIPGYDDLKQMVDAMIQFGYDKLSKDDIELERNCYDEIEVRMKIKLEVKFHD